MVISFQSNFLSPEFDSKVSNSCKEFSEAKMLVLHTLANGMFLAAEVLKQLIHYLTKY